MKRDAKTAQLPSTALLAKMDLLSLPKVVRLTEVAFSAQKTARDVISLPLQTGLNANNAYQTIS